MENKKVAIILVNYKDYAEKYLAECWASLAKQDYRGEMKIFIVDNESSEESFSGIKKIVETQNSTPLPMEIIRNKNNDGFAKGNNDAIKLALGQELDYVALFNMDTVVEKDCIKKMVEAIADDNVLDSRLRGNDKEKSRNDKKEIGAVQARMMLYDDKEKINSIGNVTHFLGFGYSNGYNKNIGNWKLEIGNSDICYPSGAGVLFRADVLKKIGLFDEEMWMYNEDQDLGWRVWLAGYRCVLAPAAIVYHKYEFSRSITKYYWMDRNRIIVMLKNYRLGTLILIFPAFIIMELGLVLFAIKGGWVKEKLKVWRYFLNIKNWQYIWRARRQAQSLRKVKDRDIISMFSGKIWYQEIDDVKLRLVNPVFNLYWRIVRAIIFW